MIATIDKDTCTGCEECVISCPDVFELNLTTYLADVKVPEVPGELEAEVTAAASTCPVGAIALS